MKTWSKLILIATLSDINNEYFSEQLVKLCINFTVYTVVRV